MRKLNCVDILRRAAVGALCAGMVMIMNAGCANMAKDELQYHRLDEKHRSTRDFL